MSSFRHPTLLFGTPWNDFTMISIIGSGAYGEVFFSTVKDKPNMQYAIKREKAESITGAIPEINAYCSFKHSYIMKVYRIYLEYDLDNRMYDIYHVMPLGRSLNSGLKQGKYNRTEKIVILHKIIEALAFLQDYGTIYGDIKTDNIIMTGMNYKHPNLSDFGMYHRVGCGEPSISQSWSDLGGYQAQGMTIYRTPEKLEEINVEYDIVNNAMWALGMTMVEIFVGTKDVIDLREKVDKVPLYVYDIMDNVDEFLSLPKFDEYNIWKPLLARLFSNNRPKYFADLLVYQGFNSIRDLIPPSEGMFWKPDPRPRIRFFGEGMDKLAHSFYESSRIFGVSTPVTSLAFEYMHKYANAILLQGSDEEFFQISIPMVGKKNLVQFFIACIELANATLTNMNNTKTIVEMLVLIKGGIKELQNTLRYLFALIMVTKGSTLIPVPYYMDTFPGDYADAKRANFESMISPIEGYSQRINDIEARNTRNR